MKNIYQGPFYSFISSEEVRFRSSWQIPQILQLVPKAALLSYRREMGKLKV